MPISSGPHRRRPAPAPLIATARTCVYGTRRPEPPSLREPSRGSMAMLAVFSVIPYELSTRTPEISSKRRCTEPGNEVEPLMKLGRSDERSILIGGDLASTASVVGTADSRVTPYFSANFQ